MLKKKAGAHLPSPSLKLYSLEPTKEAFVEKVKIVYDLQF
jgi:hypothetical protein